MVATHVQLSTNLNLPYYQGMNAPLPVSPNNAQRGSLSCVGLGMTLGSHLTPLARSHIEQADVVFAALSDGIVEIWLERMHPDVRSLQPYYGRGKSRMTTYREWVEVMMAEVRAGKRVCGFKGTFFLANVKLADVQRWRAVANEGHELANHTIFHACAAAQFPADPRYTTEAYTPASMLRDVPREVAKRLEKAGFKAELALDGVLAIRR